MNEPLLLTGFEPFGPYAVNSSWEAVKEVSGRLTDVVTIERLPVEHFEARQLLYELLDSKKPAACLCVGLGRGDAFQIEQSARRPLEFDEQDGPEILEGHWPWDGMRTQISIVGRPVAVSRDAGRYVCESTYWSLLAYRVRFGYPQEAAFLHVPPISEAFPLVTIADAVQNVVLGLAQRSSFRAGGP